MKQTHSSPFQRLVLRAVLNDVSPIVARVLSIAEDVELIDFNDIFLSMLGWQQDLGFIIRVQGQEWNSDRRRSRGKRLCDFQLRRQEKFLYVCNTLDLWEWELRVLDIQDGDPQARDPECVEGRGATPPEHCGGPRGYRLMLKRQTVGPQISEPSTIATSVQLLAQVYGEEHDIDWQVLEEAITTGWKSVEERLERSGPLTPTRFGCKEANERLASLIQRRRWW